MKLEDAKNILEKLLAALPVEHNGIEIRDADSHPRLCVTTDDSAVLIGSRGETLRALQHIVRRIMERESVESKAPHFLVDVNGYQEKRINEVRNHANLLAERARMFRYDVEMRPMNAYERMIVHAQFSDDPDITTESQGEGKFRRVVIKYNTNDAPASDSVVSDADIASRF